MHLSRLQLRRGDLNVARDLGDVVELHRTIMRAFPDSEASNPRVHFGVLYRVESGRTSTVVLVQSRVEPRWGALPIGYVERHECKSIAAAVAAVETGLDLRFLLVANPTRKSAAPRKGAVPRNSRRIAVVGDEERLAWLSKRGELGGFELTEGGAITIDALPSIRPPRRRSDGVVVRAVRFEGRLRVTDRELFLATLRDGVGPAKAYGCGMLSIAPA